MQTRESVVAGAFYTRDAKGLGQELDSFFRGLPKERKSGIVVAPHAGYIYSGTVAARSFNALKEAKTFVILGPNHTGIGESISVSGADYWETPLGSVEVDAGMREKLLAKLGIEADDTAHAGEHSIEVQLPFLQHCFRNFKILPIALMGTAFKELEELGNAIAGLGNDFGIVASSDFTHFESEESAKEKDMAAMKFIEKLDAQGFYRHVIENDLSICGFLPITAALVAGRKIGMKKAVLLKYDTSASRTGDRSNVVAYAAIRLE